MNDYYVYALWELGQSYPFYIGKGIGDRAQRHFKEAESWDGGSKFKILPSGNKEWFNVDKLKVLKESQVYVVILADNLTERKAFACECVMIATYVPSFAGGVLTNKTWGGEGVTMTPETRSKIGDAIRGRKHTEEFKSRHRLMFSGVNNPFHGKSHTEESKLMVSESRKGKGLGERNAMSRPEVRAKISGNNNVNYNIPPYLSSSVNKDESSTSIWVNAQLAYETWLDSGKKGYVVLSKLLGVDKPHKLLYMVKHFRLGWVPNLDEGWIKWKESLSFTL